MRLNAKQVAACTGGTILIEPLGSRSLMTGVTWDSREVQEGWLYVALPGERADGHDFVAAALRAGAAGALVMQAPDAPTMLLAREMGAAVIEVPGTAAAITDLARAWRAHLRGRVIGLTGSTGKTTTKNLVRDVAAAGRSVVATVGNQNNELGVPRTILAADPETEVVVVEMGMRGAGQISELCDFVRPDWGLVTNVGESHIELLGSRDAIAAAKGELFEALPAGTGRAFVNGAGDYAEALADAGRLVERDIACVAFDGAGRPEAPAAASARVWAEDVALDAEGRPRFTLRAEGLGPQPVAVPCALALRGLHNVANACAAAAVGFALGLAPDEVARALAGSLPEAGRQEVIAARGGFTIVNDAYNANPDSMRASLATFCSLVVPGRRYAVLGDMGELGDFAAECHRGVGRAAAGLPLDGLICVGELASLIAEGAVAAGMDERKITRAATVADVLGELDVLLEPGDAVLVKASHFMGLERVAEGLVS
ncbi:UDP-N-acetylmuramoyl-tripeptide--D-alanyl-D-alanine ligase [Enterorhabdus sp. P55]|uniref:UDP-N-acetylmuramoyl-tripeptide--D-alanyl-D- alanine ligase n=1 Tax=Enterorhabdus sp. P55 TaxID=2304571 RepID=UPI00136CCFB5|nr:UDP-N-acetylmuramoyl-tripeptide--D-alanyl-D-alanine ligase [Eggerthellaceae bacterium]NBI32535.1 UDP-N-acetylmuramoyl-tripeptide--D-alanyl-D-alanine ligase [Enterorhabdus sp. P55]